MKRILFICPDTSQTGAPFVLLLFIRWLAKKHDNFEIHFTNFQGGELEEEFRKVADHFIRKPEKRTIDRIKARLLNKQKRNNFFTASYLKNLNSFKYDCIYANTISAVRLGVELKKYQFQAKLLTHIHELPTTIKLLLPEFKEISGKVDAFICPSRLVANSLIKDFNISKSMIHVVYEFTNKHFIGKKYHKNITMFNIGACGTFHWRKGGDVFLQTAREVVKRFPDREIRFTWIGKLPENERIIAEADINKMQLEHKINFTGLTDKIEDYMKDLDVFLLTSREDPFPLAAIEAGSFGIPIICFDKASGTTEYLERGGGFVVPYLDISAMADRISLYYNDRQLLERHSLEVSELFRNLTPEKQAPIIFEILNSLNTCWSKI